MARPGNNQVLLVIPTYRPTESLVALISTAASQVSSVVISDDASPCTFDPLFTQVPASIGVIRHGHNAGIARGLNDGLAAATRRGAQWLLTVDQDSEIEPDYVAKLLEEAERRIESGEHLGAIGAESIIDASGVLNYPIRETSSGPITEEVIQTGTLWSVAALTEIAGFDERLGIDAVDAAACLRLRERGYVIALAPGAHLRHQIGNGTTVSVLGRTVMVTGHTPHRRTTMVRNRLRLFPAEFRQSPTHALRTLRRVAFNQTLGLVIEQQRKEKALASLKGLLPKRAGGGN
jgi:rhamnosyltransferase